MAKRLKGLYRDCEPIDQPPDTYRYANNALLSEQVGSIMSDYGLSDIDFSVSLGADFIILGHVSINKGRVVIFSVNTDGTGSKISVINPNSSIEVVSTVDFLFSPTSEIDAVFRINKDLEAVVYFTDGINPPRFVNIDSFTTYSNLNRYNIFDYVEKTPFIQSISVSNSSGILTTGAYYFSFRYIDKDGNKTNFLTLSNPIYIYDDDTNEVGSDGAEPNTPTSKSIVLQIFNVDTEYEELEIAVVKKEGGTFAPVKLLPAIPTETNIIYTHTGSESYTDGSIDEILINKASYQTAKTIEQADSILYMGNLTKAEDIGYQKYANNIQLEAVTVAKNDFIRSEVFTDPANSSVVYYPNPRYKEPILSFFQKGYQRDEVYAFYISFILKDGSETKAYHIPGRAASGDELNTVLDSASDLNAAYGSDTYNRILNISSNNPYLFQFDNQPDPNHNTGYWQNSNEEYPDTDDWDIWEVSNGVGQPTVNTLRNQKVRHHRMPDHRHEPIVSTYPSDNTTAYILQVKFKNIQIPDDIKEKVNSYKIYYAKPSNENKRVIDQSFTWRLFEGDDDQVTGNSDTHYVSILPQMSFQAYEISSEDLSDKGLACIPFYSMKNKESIASLNYLLKIYVPLDAKRANPNGLKYFYDFACHPDENNGSTTRYSNNIQDASLANFGYNNGGSAFISLKAKAFVPHAQNVVELKSKGFLYNMTTINSESQIVMESDHSNDAVNWNNSAGSPTLIDEYGFICNLMSYKDEVYNSFDKQELIWTGYTGTNLDQTETNPIGGGDIFLSKYSMRITGRAIKASNDPIHKNIISYIAESRDNVELRHQGLEYYEIYHPKSSYTEVLSIEENEANLDDQGKKIDFFDNYYGYNIDYRAAQDIKTSIPYEKIQRFESIKFPTRVIRSQEAEPGSSSDFFRTFLENDFKDFGYNRGDLVKINKYANNLLLHMERAIMITRGREELATGDFRAFLGAGNIFAVEPNELLMSEDGTGGLQNQHHSLLTEEGYFFVDQEDGSIYSLNADGLANISDIGMRNEFEKILPWNLSKYNLFNPYNADKRYIGINFGYDKEHSRIFLVKRDVTPSQDFTSKFSNGLITIGEDGQFYENGNKIDYNSSYFTPDNVCLSYVPQLNAWVSYHTYYPIYFFNSLSKFYALMQLNKFEPDKQGVFSYNNKDRPLVTGFSDEYDYNNVEQYNSIISTILGYEPSIYSSFSEESLAVVYGEFSDAEDHPFQVGFVENRSPAETKTFYSLSLITSVKDKDGVEYKDKTFTNFQLFTALQDSGSQEIIPFQSLANQGNARNVNGTWMINKFRTPNDEWWKRSRFMDKYVEVLLTYYNYDNNFLYLTNSEVGVKKTVR